jgi:hypothetical protein
MEEDCSTDHHGGSTWAKATMQAVKWETAACFSEKTGAIFRAGWFAQGEQVGVQKSSDWKASV